MREDEEGKITDDKNVTDDTCSLESSSWKENPNTIFASEKIENLDKLVNTVANMTINNISYELNTATPLDAQVGFAINKDKINLTSNRDNHQKLLSIRTIGICHKYIFSFMPTTDPNIGANNQSALLISTEIVQAQQALQSPAVQETTKDADENRTGPNMTLW